MTLLEFLWVVLITVILSHYAFAPKREVDKPREIPLTPEQQAELRSRMFRVVK